MSGAILGVLARASRPLPLEDIYEQGAAEASLSPHDRRRTHPNGQNHWEANVRASRERLVADGRI